MHFQHAFIERLENWILLFTEHHGYRAYQVDDLVSFQQYRGLRARVNERSKRTTVSMVGEGVRSVKVQDFKITA